ncbi:ABC-type nitrate/sulfonate/bicarbonate transport system permease component [Microbacterium endophyticum]|uniref:ABC-type nitrate/sulfonate/bicarbonate transport system permease component n=1 Tax=Microbacterium endophyticum TaxID=1526412 RepID=A0A7W4V5C9_9MICO|nr:ABC transporter permease subunit [Microbacterium endophyticum]MBB2977127.1 ABC-type nitrate/sulfonate/bicarbonate transport system permease component [Microbacterium endophyticum]NIK36055.1 ABC-type nitrate/sulfonate/bicarbonate transport system permease component [Microbacterium endophyticum]
MSTMTTSMPSGVTPNGTPQSAELNAVVRKQATTGAMKALGWGLATFFGTIIAVLALWVGVLWVFQISPLIAKGPVDIWNFLVTVPAAEANREIIFGNLWVTLGDAVIGFVAGLIVAILGAGLFQLSKGAESALMPVAMLLRSVPLVAMAPVIILIFGRDFWTVAVIGGIVVLFPALVNISFGLKSASPQMNDLVEVYGGGAWKKLNTIAMPSSLPAFFAAVRISVPGAITGALLAEWLAVGGGIGGSIAGYVPQAQFNALWASVVVVTAASLILYNVIQIVEDVVLARMGMTPQKGI